MIDFNAWTKATGDLDWGVQHVLRDTLQAVADEQITMVWGRDHMNGSPCLINAASNLLASTTHGNYSPSAAFSKVVSNFDEINRQLETSGVNKDYYLSPLAAEILLANFAPLKDKPLEVAVNEATDAELFANGEYREKSDTDFATEWLNSLNTEAPTDITNGVNNGPTSRNAEASEDVHVSRHVEG